MEKEADEIESADSHQHIYNSGKPGHVTEQEGYKIKAEKSDQPLVHGTYYGYGESGSIQIFITHKISLSCLYGFYCCKFHTDIFLMFLLNDCFVNSLSPGIKNILYLYLNMILLIYFNVKKHQIRKENPLTKEIEASNIQK